VWVVDIGTDDPVPLDLPDPECGRVRRAGRTIRRPQLHENRPVASNLGVRLIFGTYFNGGVRVHDVSDPFRPAGRLLRAGSAARLRAGAVQINDVLVDERRVVYAVDRLIGGLYTLELQVEGDRGAHLLGRLLLCQQILRGGCARRGCFARRPSTAVQSMFLKKASTYFARSEAL
jgi:hypothetical protein